MKRWKGEKLVIIILSTFLLILFPPLNLSTSNMIYEITTNTTDWKIFPTDEIAEIAQNILAIILTPKYSVPLDRDFGIDYSLLDAPISANQARLTAEITQAVHTFEPRAKVTEINYFSTDFSNLKAKVRFTINEI